MTSSSQSAYDDLSMALEKQHGAVDCAIHRYAETMSKGGDLAEVAASEEQMCALFDVGRKHIYFEETYLFPSVRARGGEVFARLMNREHSRIWNMFDAVQKSQCVSSADPRGVKDDLLSQLLMSLVVHNHREEMALYYRLNLIMTKHQAGCARQALLDAAVPPGWRPHVAVGAFGDG